MPLVRPFRGLGYARDRFMDLTDLVCPPYDVISPDLQAQLLARHERNAVRLELPPGDEPHQSAAATLRAWHADGTLEPSAEPTLLAYRHGTTRAPDEPSVHGILARVLLEPFGDGVRAHEHTLPGPKADRLALLRATGTQFSAILAVYFDAADASGNPVRGALADPRQARDEDGILHVAAPLEPDEELLGDLSGQRLFLADGHHRYETALAYQSEVRADPRWTDAPAGALACDWVMAVLVNGAVEELEILPTHRLIRRADAEALHGLVRDADPLWQAIPVDPALLAERLDEVDGTGTPAFGLLLPDGAGYLLIGDPDAIADRMRREGGSSALRGLDLAILHAALLRDRLGIDDARVAGGEWLAYTRSEAEARAAVARGEAQAAILVRPTRLPQLADVAIAGDVMPQKSTYFHPKLLTGFVFNPLED